MTYETLTTPAAAADAPMAHHFVKWWRNKFRNGYKKFSAGTESERTDTEELVGRAASQCSAPPDLLPSEARALLQPATVPHRKVHPTATEEPIALHPPKENTDKPRLRFEELTCDVELQHPAPSKQQPLQFSFTLYDLDGHGRMTKDDIAGIVSTIYESIGKSVTVPHYGSKTIQVRLTVIPEDETSQHERRAARRKRRHRTTTTTTCVDHSDEEPISRLSADDDASSKSSTSPERRPRKPPPSTKNPTRHTKKEGRERKHSKKRSGSLQRRELLEIIQANMEKNQLNFQTSRKTYEHISKEEDSTRKYHKLRNRSHTISEKPTSNTFHKGKSDNPNNGYLDLASGGDSNLCRYDRYLHAVICSSSRHANSGFHQRPPRRTQPPRRPPAPRAPRSRHESHNPRVLQIIFL